VKLLRGLLPALLLVAFPSAGRGEEKPDLERSVVNHYAALVSATYDDSLREAEKLQTAVGSFLDQPSAVTLAAARAAWIATRKPYLQTEAFRFYEGPIDEIDGRLNAWPVDEAYIDRVEGDPAAGIINRPDLHPELSLEVLEELNEKEGERSICTGFHAVEFLLWGQDLDPRGPGKRPHLDFVTGKEATAPNPERRKEFLRQVTAMLVRDLRTLASDWAAGNPDNYRAWFTASSSRPALQRILQGVASLSSTELAGERLIVAYETKEQEDEHSCFSDTTTMDMEFNALGIANVHSGRYRRVDGSVLEGPGLDALLRARSPELAARLSRQIEASLAAARAIPAPFDQAVLGPDSAPGRKAIHAAIGNFQEQAVTLSEAAALLAGGDANE
jgi:putative iron-regulated protein